MAKPTIIVHGGAGTIQPYIWSRFLEHAHLAALEGQRVLDAGGSALDAVVAANLVMEDDVTFNAGTGSALNREGMVECDAMVMTDDLRSGAVAGVRGVKNPVRLARLVMDETTHLLLVGPGAMKLARERGIELCDPATMITERRFKRYQQMKEEGITFETDPEREATDDPRPEPGSGEGDTVGACALDAGGRLAVGASTGGMIMKLPGRAGDTPVIGSGNYCGPAGAISCSGHGEPVMRLCLAKYAYDLLAGGASALEAAERSVAHLVDTLQGRAGLILVDRQGNRAWATSTAHIAVGVADAHPDAQAGSLPPPG